MPDAVKNFTYNGTKYAVPESQVDGFLSRKPGAKPYGGGGGSLLLEHNGTKYNVPFENVNDFLSRKPESKAIDNSSFENFTGWVQGQQAQQEIYSGIKPAGVPYAAGTVLMPGKAWESTKEQPFYIPTAEESKELAQNRIQETPSNTKGNFLSNQFEKSKNDTYDIRTGLKVAGQNAWGTVTEIPDLVTKELADRFSGPKPGDFSYGLGYNPKTIENEPIQNTAQKIAADADIRIEQHARSLQEASVGNEGWAYIGAALPTLFELGAATFSRSPELTKLVIDKMAATAYLKAGVAYDNHIKKTGENPDGMRKSAYQIANALIFKANFTALSSGLAHKAVKDFTQGLSSKIFSGSTSQQITNATELIGKAVQGSPFGKKLLNDVIHGAGIGTAFGVSQDIADRVLMGQDRTFGESVKGIAESAVSMAAFSGILSPIGLFAQKANNIERWKNSKDPIVITADANNNPVEVFRDGSGRTVDGRKVEVTPEMHDKAFAVPYSVIEKAQGEIKTGIDPTPKEREVTQYNVEMFANGVSDGKGNINIVTLNDGTTGFLKNTDGENATVFDGNGNKRTIKVQDIVNTEYTNVNDMVNERMAEWDRLNTPQPEQQQLTGTDPQQNPITPKDDTSVHRIFSGGSPIQFKQGLQANSKESVYRVTGEPQIQDIQTNAIVRSKEGKIKGGRSNEVHWSEGGDNLSYPQSEGQYILEANKSDVNGLVGALDANSLKAIWTFRNGEFVNIKDEVLQQPAQPTTEEQRKTNIEFERKNELDSLHDYSNYINDKNEYDKSLGISSYPELMDKWIEIQNREPDTRWSKSIDELKQNRDRFNEINAKYDAEISALNKPAQSEPTPFTPEQATEIRVRQNVDNISHTENGNFTGKIIKAIAPDGKTTYYIRSGDPENPQIDNPVYLYDPITDQVRPALPGDIESTEVVTQDREQYFTDALQSELNPPAQVPQVITYNNEQVEVISAEDMLQNGMTVKGQDGNVTWISPENLVNIAEYDPNTGQFQTAPAQVDTQQPNDAAVPLENTAQLSANSEPLPQQKQLKLGKSVFAYSTDANGTHTFDLSAEKSPDKTFKDITAYFKDKPYTVTPITNEVTVQPENPDFEEPTIQRVVVGATVSKKEVTTLEPALIPEVKSEIPINQTNTAPVSTPVAPIETKTQEEVTSQLTPAELDAIKALENGQRVFIQEEITGKPQEMKSVEDITTATTHGYTQFEVLPPVEQQKATEELPQQGGKAVTGTLAPVPPSGGTGSGENPLAPRVIKPIVNKLLPGVVGENVKTKYTNAPKIQGREKIITLPNNERIAGRYLLVESGTVTPSHNPNNFSQNEGFPTTPDGKTVNDRDYGYDKAAQAQVIDIANQYNGKALDNPVIVSPDGIVVSGNNRTMSGELASGNGTDASYVEQLMQDADMYGFTPEQVSSLKNPRVIFQMNETPEYTTETFAKFNASDQKTQNKVERAIKISKTIKPEQVRKIARVLDRFDTMSDAYASTSATNELIDLMVDSGIITTMDIAEILDGKTFSAIGKDMIETVLIGSVMDESSIRMMNIEGMKQYRLRITKSILPLLENQALGEYSILPEMNGAVVLLGKMRSGEFGSVYDMVSLPDMFDTTPYNLTEVLLADVLTGNQTDTKSFFNSYNEIATANKNGQLGLFNDKVQTKEEILDEIESNAVGQRKSTLNKARAFNAQLPESGTANEIPKVSPGSEGSKPKEVAEPEVIPNPEQVQPVTPVKGVVEIPESSTVSKTETVEPEKPKFKINVIPKGSTPFDLQAQKYIKNYLDQVKPKAKIKVVTDPNNFDIFALIKPDGTLVGLYNSPEKVYSAALNNDLEDVHIVRETKKENEISYDYYNGSLFGDYSGEMYDESGNLKQDVKDLALSEIKQGFGIEETPKPVSTDKPKFVGDLLKQTAKPLDETISKYGWTSNTLPDGSIQLINRNGKHAATITKKGSKYTITDLSGTKLLTGNSDVAKGAEKVIKEYFYGKENGDDAILKHRIDKKLEDKNLVAIHNINPEGIMNADRIGGLPMPSLAITNKEKGFSDFGSISLIVEKSFVDPKSNRFSKVYGSDVYSARYPSISYAIDRTGDNKIIKRVNSVITSEISSDIVHRIKSAIEDRGLKSLTNDSYAKILFLADTKKPFEYKKTELKYTDEIKQAFKDNNLTNIQYYEIANNAETKKIISDIYMTQVSPENMEYNKRFIYENGLLNDNIMRNFINDVQVEIRDSGKIDLRQTAYDAENYVRENGLTDEYNQYISDFYAEAGVTEKIFKGFSYSGNRIYVPHTLENVLKEMKKDGIRGGEKFGYGAGSVRAQVTPQFKSLDEISKNKGKINPDIDKLKDETNTELINLLEEIKQYYKFDGNRFGYYDSASEELVQVARSGKSESFNQLDKESQQKVSDFLNKLANMPTEYFEAKINRGVSLGEFKYAIIPDNTSDKVRNVLNFNNVETVEYKPGDNTDRLEKLNDLAEKDNQILFHKKHRFAGDFLNKDRVQKKDSDSEYLRQTHQNSLSLQEPTLLPNGKQYKTSEGETIRYSASEPNSGQYNLWEKDNTNPDTNTGEFCAVERQLNEQKHIDLTGPTKIKSPDDVAFLFRHLESASSENAFAVFINKNGSYKVLYLSTGSTVGTVVDTKMIAAASKEFNAESVTFVHNHPGGQLIASNADETLHSKLVEALKGICKVNPGIIINLDSGKYAEFDYTNLKTKQVDYNQKASKVKVYQFDKQVLYTPSSERQQIKSSRDVAQVLSKIKRGTDNKFIVLVLNRANHVTRAFIDSDISAEHILPIAAKHGESVIISGSQMIDGKVIEAIKKQFDAASMTVLDYIQVEPDADIFTAYKSYADEGWMEPEETYGDGTLYESNTPISSQTQFAGEFLKSVSLNKNKDMLPEKELTLNLNGAVKIEDHILFHIIGQQGATAIEGLTDNLNVAKQMTEAGKDAKTIFLATGWEKFKDGWKYDLAEIINTDIIDERTEGQYSNSFEAEELLNKDIMKAYPNFNSMYIDISVNPTKNDNSGSYTPFQNRSSEGLFDVLPEIKVKATTTEMAKSVLVHEIQHAIQDIEGFAEGGSPRQFYNGQSAKDIADEINRNYRFEVWQIEHSRAYITKKESLVGEADKTKQGWLGEIESQLREEFGINKLDDQRAIDVDEALRGVTAMKKYQSLAGEVEARNAQTRLNLTPEQRKAQMLSETQDVAEDQKIYLQGAIEKAYSMGVKPTTAQITTKANEIMSTVKYKTPLLIVETAQQLRSWYKNNNASAKHMAEIEDMINDPQCDGVFDPVYKQIVLVSPRINSLPQVESTVQHESVHATNRVFLSTRREDILQFFHDEYGADNVFDYLSSGYSEYSEVDRADEVIAYRVQEMIDNNITPTEEPYSYREIVDIVEGNEKNDNFTERLLSTIFYETTGKAYTRPDGRKPGLPESDANSVGRTGTDTEGQSQTNPVGVQKTAGKERPRFAGQLLEGGIGLLKSVSLGEKTEDVSSTEEKTNELIDILAINGITKKNYTVSKSKTDFGASNYFKFFDDEYKPILTIRVSDHSVLGNRIHGDELFYEVLKTVDEKGLKGQGLNRTIEVIKSYLPKQSIPSTITINGTPRPTTNSKGQPIADTEEKIRNFWEWFGDSKVVDDKGQPLVVYHGTTSDFNEFDESKLGEKNPYSEDAKHGFFFVSDPKKAGYFASNITDEFSITKEIKDINNGIQQRQLEKYGKIDTDIAWLETEAELNVKDGKAASIMPVYLSFSNPFAYKFEVGGFDIWKAEDILINAKKSGNDSSILTNTGEGDFYIAFSPTQIKSATGNNGDFDPDKPSILKHSSGNNTQPPTVPPTPPFAGSFLNKGGKRNSGEHGNYSDRLKYVATDKDMKHNLLHNPVQFAKDFPRYIHEMVRNPLLSVRLMEADLKTDDLSRPSDALVKVNAQANGYIHDFETKVFPDIIQAYSDIYKETKLDQDAIGEYLYAQAALERTDVLGKPAFSEQPTDDWNRFKVEQIIKDFESKVSPTLRTNLWKAIKMATDYNVETWVRTKRISPATAADYKAKKYYVPLKGWDDNPDDYYDYKSKSYGGNGNTIHKAVERSSRPEGNPIEQIVYDAQQNIKAGQRNLANHHLLRLAQNNPDKDNILNLQETWVVKEGGVWSETGIKPEQSKFDETKIAIQKINGLKVGRASVVRALKKAQHNGSSLLELSAIQDKIDLIDDAILMEGEKISVRTVWDNSNYDHRTDAQAKEHEVRVWDEGRQYVIHLNDPNVASAIKGENLVKSMDAYGWVGSQVSNLTRAWQQNVTGKALNFFIPNAVRDVQGAAVRHAIMPRGNAKLFVQYLPTAQGMTHRYIRGTAHPVYNELGDPKSPKYNPKAMTDEETQNYWDWFMDTMVKAGARSGYVHMQDLAKTRKEIRKVIKAATKGRNPLEAIQYYAWHKPGRLLEWGGIMSEDPTRIATAVATHVQGYSDELASTDAKEITVNFDRSSRIKGIMSPLAAFFQARVEGTANHLSQWKKNPKGAMKAAALWIAAGALLTEALRALMDDDEKKQFDNLQSYVKYGYYVIPKSIFGMDSGLIRIPLPHGWAAYFAMGRIIDDVIRGFITPEQGATDMVASSFNAFTPVSIDGNALSRTFIPFAPLSTPIYDASENRDFANRTVFRPYATEKEKEYTPNANMGLRDVAKPALWLTQFMNDAAGGDWKAGLAPQYTIDEQGHATKKTGFSKAAADLMDINPSKLEHAFVYYAGGRGELYTQCFKLADALISGEEVRSQYIPVVSRFTLSKGAGDVQADYYNVKNKLEVQIKQQSIAKKNDKENAKLLKSDTDLQRVIRKYKNAEKNIKTYNEIINGEKETVFMKEKYKKKRIAEMKKFMDYYNPPKK